MLIGIAISEGLIRDLQQPLSELPPQYHRIMKPLVAKVTLRQLMSMTNDQGENGGGKHKGKNKDRKA